MRLNTIAALAVAILLAVGLCACSADTRAQHAADEHQRLDAANRDLIEALRQVEVLVTNLRIIGETDTMQGVLAIAKPIQRAAVLVVNASNALPAVADVNSADWPKSTVDPVVLAEHPEQDVVPPSPPAGGAWKAALPIIGLGVIYGLKRLAPLVPGFGPIWQIAIDGAWSFAQHVEAKRADAAIAATASAAATAQPILQAIAAIPPDAMPPLFAGLADHLRDPAIATALATLAATPVAPTPAA